LHSERKPVTLDASKGYPHDALTPTALVLIFVGTKMVWLNDLFGGKFPIGVSLGIIGVVIAASVVLSLVFPKRVPEVVGGIESFVGSDLGRACTV